MQQTIVIRPGGIEYVKWPTSVLPVGSVAEVSLDEGLTWNPTEVVEGGDKVRALIASPTAPPRDTAIVAPVGLVQPWLRVASMPEIIIRPGGLLDVVGASTANQRPTQSEIATSTELASAADPINTAWKFAGRMVFNTALGRPVWATGSSPTATWVDSTGATVHTPA